MEIEKRNIVKRRDMVHSQLYISTFKYTNSRFQLILVFTTSRLHLNNTLIFKCIWDVLMCRDVVKLKTYIASFP